jgi:DNA polymerase I
MKHLLYGRDTETGIVNIEPIKGKPVVKIYSRDELGGLHERYDKYDYMVYVKSDDPILESIPDKFVWPLEGGNYYDTLMLLPNMELFMEAKKSEDCYVPLPSCQYMIQTGKTPMKGMTHGSTVIMFFDIEVYTTPGYDFPVAHRAGDRVIMIAIKTNTGIEEVLTHDDEAELLGRFIDLVQDVDPDILCNHNIFNFDLPYLHNRCKRYGIDFALGRDGSEPRVFDTKIKFAERELSYTNFNISGRDVLDTYFMVQQADIGKREMPGYGLKDVVKWLGQVSPDREYIEGKDISKVWNEDPERLIRYALDDVREVQVLFEKFGGATFMSAQFFPMSLQDNARYGTGNKCELLFVREYYKQGHSIPKPSPSRDFGGGYAACLRYGVIHEFMIYIDVTSLYPTLAQELKIHPKYDTLGIFQEMVALLKEERLYCKKMASDSEDKEMWLATDTSVKILLNTLSYGWLSSEWNPWNDYDEAERITMNGQRVIKMMIKSASELGGEPVKIDTDGMLTIPPKNMDKHDFVQEIQYLTNQAVAFGLYEGFYDEEL